MRFYVVTIFPGMLEPILSESILGRAQANGIIQVTPVDLRDFTDDGRKTVDDYPYGGGPGMVLKPEPIYRALEWVKERDGEDPKVVLLTPQGARFDAAMAQKFALYPSLVLVAGHYEGFDERIREFCDHEVSVGDFVLTGGEIPALLVVDAVSRFVPGVLGDEGSAKDDSHQDGLLEGPQYTRPPVFKEMAVPQELLGGNKAEIDRWRRKEAIRRTFQRRPELLEAASLTYEERRLLFEVLEEEKGKAT